MICYLVSILFFDKAWAFNSLLLWTLKSKITFFKELKVNACRFQECIMISKTFKFIINKGKCFMPL